MTEITELAPLQPLTADVGDVLAIVAHPDDLEYGAAAAIARWVREGHRVAYLLATRGEAGIDGVEPGESARLREEEQRASARVVGVDVVEFLDYRDGVIEETLELRRDLAAAIRRHKPDTVLLINHRETFGPGRRNQADHRVVGAAALDAVPAAANRWIFPEIGLDPHRVRLALVANSPLATHALDVTGFVDDAVASLAEHRAYLEGLGEHPMSDPEFVRMFFETTGQRFGGKPAVSFEVFEF